MSKSSCALGIEMKFKNLLYPVILAPAYIPELNDIQHTEDGKQAVWNLANVQIMQTCSGVAPYPTHLHP